MKTKTIKLDGKTNGFRAYLIEEEEFLKDEDGKLIQTKSLEALKSYLYSYGYTNPYGYKVWIIDEEVGIDVDFDDTEYIDDHYEYYENDTKYIILDNRTRKITSIGYFVFDNGDHVVEKMATKNGQEISKKYYAELKDSLNDLVKSIVKKPYIDKVFRRDKELCCSILGTTINLHFLYNWDFINLNNKRKEKDVRCIPYLKTVDRYRTLMLYTTRSIVDYSINDSETEIQIIDRIMNRIKSTGQEVKYIPVEFKGTIIDMEEG